MRAANTTFSGYTAETCPDRAKHLGGPGPSGYLQWHSWAEEMRKTHVQTRCPTCQLWVIWKPKRKRKVAARTPSQASLMPPKKPSNLAAGSGETTP